MSTNTKSLFLDADTNSNTKHSTLYRLMMSLTSLCIPGLGQIACGRLQRGFLQIGAYLVCLSIFLQVRLMEYPFFGIAVVSMMALIRLYSAFDAYKISRYKNIELQTFRRWTYVLISSLCVLLLQAALLSVAEYRTCSVRGNLLYPTLHDHEILMTKRGHTQNNRSDLVTFHPVSEEDANTLYLGRIVAVEGDVVSLKNGNIWLNNQAVNEPYVYKKSNSFMQPINLAPVTVPAGYVFILGDNRYGFISSSYGLVPSERIEGQILYILFSPTLRRAGLRV